MKIEFNNNQYDFDGTYKFPKVETKFIRSEVAPNEFFTYYFHHLNVPEKLYSVLFAMYRHQDKAGQFDYTKFDDLNLSMGTIRVYLSEIYNLKLFGKRIIKPVRGTVYKINPHFNFKTENQQVSLIIEIKSKL